MRISKLTTLVGGILILLGCTVDSPYNFEGKIDDEQVVSTLSGWDNHREIYIYKSDERIVRYLDWDNDKELDRVSVEGKVKYQYLFNKENTFPSIWDSLQANYKDYLEKIKETKIKQILEATE